MNEQGPYLEAALENQVHQLRSAEVEVPEAWRVGIDPRIRYPGECYIRAFRYVWDLVGRIKPNDQVWLVHGEYGLSTGHAWVELPGDAVFDGVLQRFYEKRGYYEIHSASPWYKYSPLAASVIGLSMPKDSSGKWRCGAWHIVLKLPWADPQNPTEIDHHRAIELLIASGLRPDLAKPSKNSRSAKKRGRP
jgi:hypothetical protein